MEYLLKILLIFCISAASTTITSGPVITNIAPFMTNNILQVGNAIACYSLAKMLSTKYNIPFVYSHFNYHDAFAFSSYEQSDLTIPIWTQDRTPIFVNDERDIINNLDKHVIFYTGLRTKIDYIDANWVNDLRTKLKLKNAPEVFELPQNIITVGVHIRKGNGGGQIYDGELSSLQEFDCNKRTIQYILNFENYPFEWHSYQRNNGQFINDLDKVIDQADALREPTQAKPNAIILDRAPDAATYFPPEQFYIDQIIKTSNELHDSALFVQLCTDDKDPISLLTRIKNAVNKPNISFHYEDNRHLSYRERILMDLYMLARCHILIRSQSTFARLAELMGNHALVVYPLKHRWEGQQLFMTTIIMRSLMKKNFFVW